MLLLFLLSCSCWSTITDEEEQQHETVTATRTTTTQSNEHKLFSVQEVISAISMYDIPLQQVNMIMCKETNVKVT